MAEAKAAAEGIVEEYNAVMSADFLRHWSGSDDLETIEEIELIFTPVTEMGSLENCVNLRSLILIQTGLRRISNVACIGRSLEKLMLIDQGITTIENLFLPNLKELGLQHNSITKLENLEGCPKLQKLWLFENQIAKIENLQCLGDLRELWLQSNKFTRITGLEQLVNLESLSLANNRIADFKDLQRLAMLPSLRVLSFRDGEFGSCPVAAAEGYRHFVLCALKQVRVLDGVEVGARDRARSEDVYMSLVLAFNQRVDAVRGKNQRELLAIEARRRRNLASAEALRSELRGAFHDLESVVTDGRAKISAEHSRQTRVRDSNLRALEGSLASLRRQHRASVDALLAVERQKLAAEERWFLHSRQRLRAQRDHAVLLSRLQYSPHVLRRSVAAITNGSGSGDGEDGTASGSGGSSGGSGGGGSLAAQEVSEHAPRFRLVASRFKSDATAAAAAASRDKQGGSGSGAASAPSVLRPIKLYRVHNPALHSRFMRAAQSDSAADASSPLHLYITGGARFLANALQHGFGSGGGSGGGGSGAAPAAVVLFPNPYTAVRAHLLSKPSRSSATATAAATSASGGASDGGGGGGAGGPEESGGVDVDAAGSVHHLLLCRVALGRVHPLPLRRSLSAVTSAANLQALLRQMSAEVSAAKVRLGGHSASGDLPLDGEEGEEEERGGSGSGDDCAYIVRGSSGAGRVLPEFTLLAAPPLPVYTPPPEAAAVARVPGSKAGGGKEQQGGGGSGSRESLDAILGELTLPTSLSTGGASQLLAGFTARVDDELRAYERRVWREVEPEAARELADADGDARRLSDTLRELRSQIDTEKSLQEHILREFRAQFSNGGSGGGSSAERVRGRGR